MKDREGRVIDYMRISLTDRCNLRCRYCMPEEGIALIKHDDILRYEEIVKIVQASVELGIKKIRLTGGEPLLRKNITYLIKEIKNTKGIEEVSITTNGLLLDSMLDGLHEAGLDRINLSLDTLKEDVFKSITRFEGAEKIKRGMIRALEKGIKVKVNTVMIKGINDEEIEELVSLTDEYPIDVRFIELMPIGCGKQFKGIQNDEILERLRAWGKNPKQVHERKGNGPAVYYKMDGARGTVGFISPMSHQFCDECNRVRITPEGFLKTCLHSKDGTSLRDIIRNGADKEELLNIIKEKIHRKPKEHHFLGEDEMKDDRSMNQIGG